MTEPRAAPLPARWRMHTSVDATTTKVDRPNRIVRSVITSRGADRSGDVVIPSGLLNARQYLRNPVVLWAHQRTWPPIGACQKLEIIDDRIIAETKFSESSQLATDVFNLYAEGILRGWSIGFVPQEAIRRPPSKECPNGSYCFMKWDLLEYSAVPIPDNPEALTLAICKGTVSDRQLRGWLIQDVLAALHA
jgi:uncharacterized protein